MKKENLECKCRETRKSRGTQLRLKTKHIPMNLFTGSFWRGWIVLAISLPANPLLAVDASAAKPTTNSASALLESCVACRFVLVPSDGTNQLDRQILQAQRKVKADSTPGAALEQLGWLYVANARRANDAGFYKLAEQCAACLEKLSPHAPEALLLRGHVLHNLHQFNAAEVVARELMAARGLAFDHGLLGDALMEQGRLNEAADAYQRMVDLKPGLQAFARIAHLRWLKGDLAGALEVMELASHAASPHDPESFAWVYVRLGGYQLQAGHRAKVASACALALEHQPDCGAAFLLRGRLLLVEGKKAEALEPLRRAATLLRLPESQWLLADALRLNGRDEESRAVEKELRAAGAMADPRSFSLYLATRGEQTGPAVRLAEAELKSRADVFTYDALAWALHANGQTEAAWRNMERALGEGTQDARLFYHASVIAAAAQRTEDAQRWMNQARPLAALLLPSEADQLSRTLVKLGDQPIELVSRKTTN